MNVAEKTQMEKKPRLKLMLMFLPDHDQFYRYGYPIKEKFSSFIMEDVLDNPYYVAKNNVVKLKGLPAGCAIAMTDEMGRLCNAAMMLRNDWNVGTPLVVSYGSITSDIDSKCLLVEKSIMDRLLADGFAIADHQVNLEEPDDNSCSE